ncbi:hypothetical protein G4B88_022579 [Cannabis sativa]|uniref:Cytochrome b561 domain-containing protein n=1 Tax=Cannabis sativa TaxID=3483 RepID=A0A7J6HW89_CANSA|nr:hypothetical protein G4B88_022579 [Cannabis sativa]
MAGKLASLVVLLSVFSTLFLSSSAQTCKSYNFARNQQFQECNDLAVLNSFLHWTFDSTTGKLNMAYRHTGVTSSTWVAWAINPSNNLASAMPGAQSLVAYPRSSGGPRVYTSPIGQTYQTSLAEGNLTYPVWQSGPLSGTTIGPHQTSGDNTRSKSSLNLLSGQSQSGGGSSTLRKRNTHGVLNAVSWGILMPMGAVIARYLKVFKSADPAWFYLHVTCQTSAYIVGVAGWGTGLKLGSDSVGITQNPHRNIGIALFCLGTLQVFALLLRPKKDHKYRLYWNIYHHTIGYAVIILSIINIYEGFDILQPEEVWKRAYTGIIIGLGAVAVSLKLTHGFTY